MSQRPQTERRAHVGNEFSSYLFNSSSAQMLLPNGLICFLHSDLAGNLWGNGVGINPAKKPNVSVKLAGSAQTQFLCGDFFEPTPIVTEKLSRYDTIFNCGMERVDYPTI